MGNKLSFFGWSAVVGACDFVIVCHISGRVQVWFIGSEDVFRINYVLFCLSEYLEWAQLIINTHVYR